MDELEVELLDFAESPDLPRTGATDSSVSSWRISVLVGEPMDVESGRDGSHGLGLEGGLYIKWRSWSMTCTTESARFTESEVKRLDSHSTGIGPSFLCLELLSVVISDQR